MTSILSFTFFCSYLFVVPLLVGFLFQDVSRYSRLLPSFFMVGLLRAMVVRADPSLIRTLLGVCGLSSLQDEVQTLPGQCARSPVGAHTPRSLGTLPWLVLVISASSKMRCRHSLVDAHSPQWVRTLPGRWAHTLVGACGQFPPR